MVIVEQEALSQLHEQWFVGTQQQQWLGKSKEETELARVMRYSVRKEENILAWILSFARRDSIGHNVVADLLSTSLRTANRVVYK